MAVSPGSTHTNRRLSLEGVNLLNKTLSLKGVHISIKGKRVHKAWYWHNLDRNPGLSTGSGDCLRWPTLIAKAHEYGADLNNETTERGWNVPGGGGRINVEKLAPPIGTTWFWLLPSPYCSDNAWSKLTSLSLRIFLPWMAAVLTVFSIYDNCFILDKLQY